MDARRQQFHYFGTGTITRCQGSYRTYPPRILFAVLFDRGGPIHWARDTTLGYTVVGRLEGRLPELFDEYDRLGSRSTEKASGRATIPARLTDLGTDPADYTGLSPAEQDFQLALHNRIPPDEQFTTKTRLHWLSSTQLLQAGKDTANSEQKRKQAICYVLSDDQLTEFMAEPDPGPARLRRDFSDIDPNAPVSWAYFIAQISLPADYPITIDDDRVYLEVVDEPDSAPTSVCLSLADYRRWLFDGTPP